MLAVNCDHGGRFKTQDKVGIGPSLSASAKNRLWLCLLNLHQMDLPVKRRRETAGKWISLCRQKLNANVVQLGSFHTAKWKSVEKKEKKEKKKKRGKKKREREEEQQSQSAIKTPHNWLYPLKSQTWSWHMTSCFLVVQYEAQTRRSKRRCKDDVLANENSPGKFNRRWTRTCRTDYSNTEEVS